MNYFKICFLILCLLPYNCCKKKKNSLIRIGEQRPATKNTSAQSKNIPYFPFESSIHTTSQAPTCEDEGFDETGFYILKNGQKTYPQYKHTPQTKEDLIKLLDTQTPLNEINIYHIADMNSLFLDRSNYNFEGIENWSVCRVTNMSGMFYSCVDFNQDLSKWKVDNVRDMTEMFENCYLFDQDLSSWKMNQKVNIENIFESTPMQDKTNQHPKKATKH